MEQLAVKTKQRKKGKVNRQRVSKSNTTLTLRSLARGEFPGAVQNAGNA